MNTKVGADAWRMYRGTNIIIILRRLIMKDV